MYPAAENAIACDDLKTSCINYLKRVARTMYGTLTQVLVNSILIGACLSSCTAQDRQLTPEQKSEIAKAQELDEKLLAFNSQGKYREALETGERVLRIRENVLGKEHLEVAQALQNIAILYDRAGELRRAEEFHLQSLKILEKIGPNHPTTASTLEGLARVYRQTGRQSLALPLLQRSLKINEDRFGPQHLTTSRTLNNLAVLHDSMQNFKLAESLYLRVVSIRERLSGPEDPGIATPLLNLGSVCVSQNRLTEAEVHYKRALAIVEKHIGPESRETAELLLSLGRLRVRTRQFDSAEPLLVRSLQIMNGLRGTDHPDTVSVLGALAKLYSDQGRHSDAGPLHERVVRICEEKLVPEHPYTFDALVNFAEWCSDRGRLADAERLYRRTVEIQEKVFGADHQEVVICLKRLADFYIRHGRVMEAEPLCQRMLQICEATVGSDSLLAAKPLSQLAIISEERGNYAEAVVLCRRVLKILDSDGVNADESREAALSSLAGILRIEGSFAESEALYRRALDASEARTFPEDPILIPTLNGLAQLLQDQGNYTEAEELMERVLKIREAIGGPDDPDTAKAMNNLAVVRTIRGNVSSAEVLYKRVMGVLERVYGPDHVLTAFAYNNVAAFYRSVGKLNESRALYERALEIRKSALGADNPLTLMTGCSLAGIHARMGDTGAAMSLFKESLGRLEKALGAEHPEVIDRLDSLASMLADSGSTEALEVFDRARQGAFRHARRTLVSLTEAEQRLFLSNRFEPELHSAMSFALQNGASQATVSTSAAWAANCKGLIQDVLADRNLRLRDRSDAKAGPLLKDLERTQRQLARLAMEVPEATDVVARGERFQELTQRASRLSKELALAVGADTEVRRWVTTEELRRSISAGSALIDIARFDAVRASTSQGAPTQATSRYVAWITLSEDAQETKLVDLGSADEIDAIIQDIRKAIQADGGSEGRIRGEGEPEAVRQLNATMTRLADRIWKPIAPHLKDVRSLMLSPDSELWLAPWAALPVGDNSEPLIREYSLRFLLRGSDVAAGKSTAKSTSVPVIFADPGFNSGEAEKRAAIEEVLGRVPEAETTTDNDGLRGYSGIGLLPQVLPLPNTAIEAQLIGPKIEKLVRLKPAVYQTKFALESVAKSLKRPRMAVFATHGFFLPGQAPGERDSRSAAGSDQPEGRASGDSVSVTANPLLRCGLLLAGCNRRGGVTNDDDGILTGLEITGIDFRGTDMVVLSACETGVGDIRNGEGVAGLRQAFQLAGARTVVATLWQIPDRDSAIIMNDFFDNIAKGESAAEAMRQAQLKRIDSRTRRYGAAHPLFWAAWTVTE
jgi:tetratricopeptide (TPR) repeat protein/CHAT domain-containing protein